MIADVYKCIECNLEEVYHWVIRQRDISQQEYMMTRRSIIFIMSLQGTYGFEKITFSRYWWKKRRLCVPVILGFSVNLVEFGGQNYNSEHYWLGFFEKQVNKFICHFKLDKNERFHANWHSIMIYFVRRVSVTVTTLGSVSRPFNCSSYLSLRQFHRSFSLVYLGKKSFNYCCFNVQMIFYRSGSEGDCVNIFFTKQYCQLWCNSLLHVFFRCH